MTARNGGLHKLIVCVHVGFAASIFLRPHLPEISPSYQRFDDVLPWLSWGYVALGVAALMLLSRPGTLWGQMAHFLSSTWFFLVAAVFAGGIGVTSAVTTYTVLAFGSLALFGNEYSEWLKGSGIVTRLVSHLPRSRNGP